MLGRYARHFAQKGLDQRKVSLQIMREAGNIHVAKVNTDLPADPKRPKSVKLVIFCLEGFNVVGIVGNRAGTTARAIGFDHIQGLADVFGQRPQGQPECMNRAFKPFQQVDRHQCL